MFLQSGIFFIIFIASFSKAAAIPEQRVLESNPKTCASPADAAEVAESQANNVTLIEELELAATMVDRLSLLPDDAEFIFDFNTATDGVTQGRGGKTVRADRKTFPALVDNGGSVTVGFLEPCSINTPHIHNRATQLNVVIQGQLNVEFTVENGARHIELALSPLQMTVIPQGAMHTEFNAQCKPAVFVAAFPDEDPGVQQIAQTFFGFSDTAVEAALGSEDIEVGGRPIDGGLARAIPDNVAPLLADCRRKCRLS